MVKERKIMKLYNKQWEDELGRVEYYPNNDYQQEQVIIRTFPLLSGEVKVGDINVPFRFNHEESDLFIVDEFGILYQLEYIKETQTQKSDTVCWREDKLELTFCGSYYLCLKKD